MSNFRYEKQLLIVVFSNFLRNLGKLFGKSRGTCGGKPYVKSWERVMDVVEEAPDVIIRSVGSHN